MTPAETLEHLDQLGQNDQHPSQIPYAWQIQGQKPGPTITVFGAVHGNETVGLPILAELLQTPIQNGTLNLAVGNPEAVLVGTRGTAKDLNRCFGVPGTEYEHQRATELATILQATDVLFDLHATIKPSDPFLVVAGMQHQLAACLPHLGIKLTLTGKGIYSPDGSAICTDTFTAQHGGLGITIEAGWLQDPKTAEIKFGLTKALTALGLIDGQITTPSPALDIVDCYQAIAPTGPDFQFTEDWQNFAPIPAGTIFAHDGNIALATTRNSKIIFPKSGPLAPGTIACIFATA